MSARRRQNRPSGSQRRPGVVLVAMWLIVLLAALSVVTWRQARGVEMESVLREMETRRAVAEADRVAAEGRIEELRSRARVVREARERLGMHVPADQSIVFLPIPTDTGPGHGSTP